MSYQKIHQLLKRIFIKTLQILSMVYLYLPIIRGILFPMVFLFPIFYATITATYWPNSLPFFGVKDVEIHWFNPGTWLSAYYVISFDKELSSYVIFPDALLLIIFLLLGIEIIIFCLGCSLFLVGLIQLAQGKKHGEKIVQRGIYRHIRHPQHVGICLMALPFALYIPWVNDFGIRIGDLLTWICFTLLLVIYSDIEEYLLKKRFPDEFSVYQAKTGFMFPQLLQLNRFKLVKRIKENYFLKYTLLFVGFIIFLDIFQFIVEALMEARILAAFR